MIIVTGTKRSGTSMWMQILVAAGFDVIGERFPRNWAETILDANPKGFYESKLCSGVYYATNPDPASGAFLFPDQVVSHAVKVFIPGVVRTELAFIDRCIATMRPWQEYAASLRKLQALSSEAEDLDDDRGKPSNLAPELQWWNEYFMLLRDVATRCYPIHMEAYENLVADPHKVLTEVFAWIGDGDVDAACRTVDAQLYRNRAPGLELARPDLPDTCLDAFDALYSAVARGKPLSASLIEKLNHTHKLLEPYFLAHQAAVTEHFAREIGG